MDEYDKEVKAFIGSKAVTEFIVDEYKLISTMMGARNHVTNDQWLALKTNAGIDHSNNPIFGADFEGIGEFRGIYTLLQDITGQSLEALQSSWADADVRREKEEEFIE